MANRQSNTHQPSKKLITGFRGGNFTKYIYTIEFGSGKMKELIRTCTPFTDWDPLVEGKRYGPIKQLLHMDDNNVHLLVWTDGKQGNWGTRWDTYRGSKKLDSIYYYSLEEKDTGDLPWECSAINSSGTMLSKYMLQGARNYEDVTKARIDFIDINRERNGKTLKQEITEFTATYNMTLPDHDIEDPRMYQIGVNYRGGRPMSITYFINIQKPLATGRDVA